MKNALQLPALLFESLECTQLLVRLHAIAPAAVQLVLHANYLEYLAIAPGKQPAGLFRIAGAHPCAHFFQVDGFQV